MQYGWDERKRRSNILKHGVDFILAYGFDWNSAAVAPDPKDYGEHRLRATGYIGNRLYRMIYTERGNITRIISLRKANKREKRSYEKTIS